MLEGMFGESERLHIEPLSEQAKAAIADASLILSLKQQTDKIKRLEEFVRYAQEDNARVRNSSDPADVESAKRSTMTRFTLLDLSEATSLALTNAIYDR